MTDDRLVVIEVRSAKRREQGHHWIYNQMGREQLAASITTACDDIDALVVEVRRLQEKTKAAAEWWQAFTADDVAVGDKSTVTEAFEALRQAGGDGWDNVDDPQALIDEVRGGD